MADLTRRSLLLSTVAIPLAVAGHSLPPAPAPVWNGVFPLPKPTYPLTAAEMRMCWEYVVGLEARRMPGL